MAFIVMAHLVENRRQPLETSKPAEAYKLNQSECCGVVTNEWLGPDVGWQRSKKIEDKRLPQIVSADRGAAVDIPARKMKSNGSALEEMAGVLGLGCWG